MSNQDLQNDEQNEGSQKEFTSEILEDGNTLENDLVVEEVQAPTLFQGISRSLLTKPDQNRGQWLIVGASVIGKSHIGINKPCQDNHFLEDWGKGWGIAVVADGAGSAEMPEKGAKFIVEHAVPNVFRELVETKGWMTQDLLPSDEVWQKSALESLRECRVFLALMAKEKSIPFNELACTVIVSVFSPTGLLVCHIGDGRAGFRNQDGTWEAMIDPFQGEEANETVFITTNFWAEEDLPKYVGSKVIRKPVTAFSLLSDGCESTAFESNIFLPDSEKFEDPNRPFPGFFDPLFNQMTQVQSEGIPLEELESKWELFVNKGNRKLEYQPDDKTLILGIYSVKVGE